MESMGMGGMDMGSEGPFRPTNMHLARSLWYAIAAFVGVLAVKKVATLLEIRRRLQRQRQALDCIPSRPQGLFSQTLATVVAMGREASYAQPIYFSGRVSKFFTPLPAGHWILLCSYWLVLLCLLWTDVFIEPSSNMYAYRWEKIGFRAAWVSVSQIPLIYLLSCKFNPISLVTGISYERFNWLHRWAARTVFLTVIVHWSFFFREWDLGNIISVELKMMPMVKYGFGAWATIGWMVLTSFGFARSVCYEIWVLQHIAAAATLLWLLHTHVPSYAKYNVYLAIGFIAFDWLGRLLVVCLRNLRFTHRSSSTSPSFGYRARLDALSNQAVYLTIDDVDFTWRAGQHCYISIPAVRPFEMHPFTIANADCPKQQGSPSRQLKMLIKARTGFTRSLNRAAAKNATGPKTYQAFLSGPWGNPPNLSHFETIVLIACGGGISFVLPILQDIASNQGYVARTIQVHWIFRSKEQFNWLVHELCAVRKLMEGNRSKCHLHMNFHVTRCPSSSRTANYEETPHYSLKDDVEIAEQASATSSSSRDNRPLLETGDCNDSSNSCTTWSFDGRPPVESLIRPCIERASGESAIVLCGGMSITAQTRTFVAKLSDERAVHKGTGAQGIFLFTESFVE